MPRYIINCSICGRAVGKTGFHDYDVENRELGSPLCKKCLNEQNNKEKEK